MDEKPTLRSFWQSAKRFGAGPDTPRDYFERCVATIGAWELEVGAFAYLDIEGARTAADSSTVRWRNGKPLSAIDGMPVGIKDILETVDMPTQQGSPIFEGFRTVRDAAAVTALRAAGAVIVGKTVTTEFAASHPRGTRNPWDLARTPGGSSSGSAAAVGCGMLPAALGTQVIGSIIRPASFCGCVGFKPTLGAINRGGTYDHSSQSSLGLLAASLPDAWHVAYNIASRVGGDPGFPGLIGQEELPTPLKPRALALLQTAGWSSATAPSRVQLDGVRDRLIDAGVPILTRSDTPRIAEVEDRIADALHQSLSIATWEGRWPLSAYAAHDASKLSPVARARVAAGARMTVDQYYTCLAERERIRNVYQSLVTDVDGIITLAAPGAAPIGLESTGDPEFAVPFSLLGVPAVSLPLLQEHELPLGLQLAGFANQDLSTIAMAAWLTTQLGNGAE
jgi:Asp-tRNA(Asn)/Glu-tRNA(Gln) amidotransferase A subunit family amidase